MQAHQLKKPKHLQRKQRVGRGGKRGTYSGRGLKGQKARAGARIRPEIRDYIAKIPKLTGPTNKAGTTHAVRPRPLAIIDLSDLNTAAQEGSVITLQLLAEHKLIKKYKGVFPRVKILANGTVTKGITVQGLEVSHGTRVKIEEAGGTVR